MAEASTTEGKDKSEGAKQVAQSGKAAIGMGLSHSRHSIRLRDFDYTSPGAYFVTICARERGSPFGGVADGEIHRTREGQVACETWIGIPEHFLWVTLDDFVIMPDHLHGIIVINDRGGGKRCEGNVAAVASGDDVGAPHAVPLQTIPRQTERFGRPVAASVPTIVRSFKAAATRRINELRGTPGAVIWQSGYYEHVVRDEEDLDRIRRYIADNPPRWNECTH
jgi:putative transposase